MCGESFEVIIFCKVINVVGYLVQIQHHTDAVFSLNFNLGNEKGVTGFH